MIKMQHKEKAQITSIIAFITFSIILASIPITNAAGPYDWPMFRHDLWHTGYSTSPAPITNQTLWTYTTGNVTASAPAVVDGKVYVGSWDRKIYCLNAATGAHIWNYTTGDMVDSSPAVADGRVYVGSYDGKIYCLDAASGAYLWSYTTGGAVPSSPAVANGMVYVSSWDQKIYCLDATTGVLIWNYTTGNKIGSSPAVVDGKVYVGSDDANVYCLNALSGALLWNYTTGGAVESPAFADGKIYAGSLDNRVYCLDATTGAHIWNYTTGNDVQSSPAVADGKVYIGSGDGKIYCLDALTGAHIWNYTTGGLIVYSAPIVADGKVYISSNDMKVWCLNAADGALIWSYKTGGMLGYSSASIANGVVYIGSLDSKVYAFSSGPPISDGSASVWNKTYGGTANDLAGTVIHTSDGGYAIFGSTASFGAGGNDVWLIKTDAAGNVQWNQTYGGTLNEAAYTVRQTSEGGYVMSCSTMSFGAGGEDAWLVKTDSAGNIQWNKTYGGTGTERGWSVTQTVDGGYAVVGWTSSVGAGGADAWLVKTDATGNMQWNKTYGGNGTDYGLSLLQTGDGGYTLMGSTQSFGLGSINSADLWLIRTDATGNMQWNKTYGGTGYDEAYVLIPTSDGGYSIGGWTGSFGAVNMDLYLVKTDETGNMQWNKTYGGTGAEFGGCVVQTSDGGYAQSGYTNSFGAGGNDLWLVRTDSAGNMQWNKTYGETGNEAAYCVIQTSDGGFLLGGQTNSFGAGGNDIWLVKVDELGVVPEGLTIGVMMLLSTVAVIVSLRYFRKRPKTENFSQVKL
jgi:outer membrane protein assembly factor BamB